MEETPGLIYVHSVNSAPGKCVTMEVYENKKAGEAAVTNIHMAVFKHIGKLLIGDVRIEAGDVVWDLSKK